MSMEDLVDILAQNTQTFTQLLAERNFGENYIKTKEAIQAILAEIEARKESSRSDTLI